MKTLIQCDFDGTITEVDASFLVLEEFASGDWHQVLQEHREHKISVGQFNARTFSMVKVEQKTLLKTIMEKVKLRAGFSEFVDYCSKRDFRLVIVSNGLDFYLQALLDYYGLGEVEWHAARTCFKAGTMEVQYIGPDGKLLDDAFKEAYVQLFLTQNYRVIYVGNGDSDIAPAKQAQHVFAREELLSYYQGNGLKCEPFEDFTNITKEMELL